MSRLQANPDNLENIKINDEQGEEIPNNNQDVINELIKSTNSKMNYMKNLYKNSLKSRMLIVQ